MVMQYGIRNILNYILINFIKIFLARGTTWDHFNGDLWTDSEKISSNINSLLTTHFTMEEIKLIIFGMGFDKAPGPDGFYIFFYQTY
jgi:hypothetical protein